MKVLKAEVAAAHPELEERAKIFDEWCKENGLDPDDVEFGSQTLTAWMWFSLGWDREAPKKEITNG